MKRIELLDLARGVALIAMCIFHFAFDLELFGLVEQGFIEQPHWKYFARAIATSFLFLVGVSLYLAHSDNILWRAWRWRFAKISAAALLITIATYLATPGQYIFFGILHQIAFASFAALAFLKLPALAVAIFAALTFWIGQNVSISALDYPILYWTGLTQMQPNSSDFVPVFPWFSPVLFGVVAAKLAERLGLLERLGGIAFTSRPSQVLMFFGKNSLVFYLVHQPIMIAGLLGYLFVTGKIVF